jgi:hypothetical protein
MDPNIWGPHLWIFLHSMSFTYAEDRLHATKREQREMYTFLKSLQYVLPCVCKFNYKMHFENYPPRLKTRRDLFEWLVDLHNIVNLEYNKKNSSRNIKPKRTYTYKEVEDMYRKMYSKKD